MATLIPGSEGVVTINSDPIVTALTADFALTRNIMTKAFIGQEWSDSLNGQRAGNLLLYRIALPWRTCPTCTTLGPRPPSPVRSRSAMLPVLLMRVCSPATSTCRTSDSLCQRGWGMGFQLRRQ